MPYIHVRIVLDRPQEGLAYTLLEEDVSGVDVWRHGGIDACDEEGCDEERELHLDICC